MSFYALQAQDVAQQIGIALKENVDMKIYVDGKPFDFPLELINTDHIASINIIKGAQAEEKYQSPEGVISIVTKDIPKPMLSEKKSSSAKPLFVVDGEIREETVIDTISPDDIDHIEVIKGERAIQEYNSPNGVILITTKNVGKRKKNKKNKN